MAPLQPAANAMEKRTVPHIHGHHQDHSGLVGRSDPGIRFFKGPGQGKTWFIRADIPSATE
jgi:hypothetical protein